jgi:PTS system nitrogen regulatory IIA component
MSVTPEDKSDHIKILDLLEPAAILPDLKANTKKAVLEELVELLVKSNKVQDAQATVQILMERETIGSTGIGQGIAIPHAKTDQTKTVIAAFGLSKKGISFAALDGEPVHIVFLLIAPPDAASLHLKALGRINRMLRDKFFRQSLRDAKSTEEILRLIREEDRF